MCCCLCPSGSCSWARLPTAPAAAAAALALPIALACGALSVAIEFGQIFVDGRTPSWNDVVAESLGGALGALLWVIVGSAVVEWMAGIFRSESERDRVYRILGAYVGVWAILGLLPLDFTVRLEELGEKFRAGRIVLEPFPSGWTLRDTGGTLLMAIPVGAFGVALSRRRTSAAAGPGRPGRWPVAGTGGGTRPGLFVFADGRYDGSADERNRRGSGCRVSGALVRRSDARASRGRARQGSGRSRRSRCGASRSSSDTGARLISRPTHR